MNNYQLFRRSLSNHPGLPVGCVWPVIVLAAMAENLSFELVPFLVLCTLPWFFIVGTAWMLRNSSSEVGHG